jgi:hypothetical protein
LHGFTVIIDVLKDIEGDHRIKAGIHEWQFGATGFDDIRVAAFAAKVEGHWFDIHAGCRSDTA